MQGVVGRPGKVDMDQDRVGLRNGAHPRPKGAFPKEITTINRVF